jgi:hypothetical protein
MPVARIVGTAIEYGIRLSEYRERQVTHSRIRGSFSTDQDSSDDADGF